VCRARRSAAIARFAGATSSPGASPALPARGEHRPEDGLALFFGSTVSASSAAASASDALSCRAYRPASPARGSALWIERDRSAAPRWSVDLAAPFEVAAEKK
jgi:hypothetical protein